MLELLLSRFRARLRVGLARAGLTLPWWIPVCTAGVSAAFTVVAVAQRGVLWPPEPVALAGLVAVAGPLGWAVTGAIMPGLAVSAQVASAAILLAHPVFPDFAPMLMLVATTEAATVLRVTQAITVACVSIAALGAAAVWVGLDGAPVYMVAVLLCFSGGFMVRWYMRALAAERGKREAAWEKAMLAERQRIAREVHDVVGHSLSITLLHLTGARRALQQDRDVDEAIEALTEAEQVGRAAMDDIRRTVGLLADASSGPRPLPGVDDIAALVERTRAAGLDVGYRQDGDLTVLGTSEGLGLYRIVQESLGNIVKHAPEATVEVSLYTGPVGTRLTVRNSLPGATSHGTASGSGLAGMSARAALLGASFRAGPSGRHWVVDVTVPGSKAVAP